METLTVKTRRFYPVPRALLFLLIWWFITNGDPASWWIGIPAVVLALIVSSTMISPVFFVWSEIPRFVAFFLWHSLLGGVDVARRDFSPSLPIAPGLLEYPLRLPPGLPQVFMANAVGLLPGTLSAELQNNVLSVHVLDRRSDVLTELDAVECSVARMFGIPLDNSQAME